MSVNFLTNPTTKRTRQIKINIARIIEIIFKIFKFDLLKPSGLAMVNFRNMIKNKKLLLKIANYPKSSNRIDKWIIETINIINSIYQEQDDKKIIVSRSKIKNLLINGNIFLDNKLITDPSYTLKNEQEILINFPEPVEGFPKPEKIKLTILYEDNDLMIINKNAGIVVHPAPGNETGTLVNAILYHCKNNLSGIGGVKRPGIVHRLDKDTSGLMVIAKTEIAHLAL